MAAFIEGIIVVTWFHLYVYFQVVWPGFVLRLLSDNRAVDRFADDACQSLLLIALL